MAGYPGNQGFTPNTPQFYQPQPQQGYPPQAGYYPPQPQPVYQQQQYPPAPEFQQQYPQQNGYPPQGQGYGKAQMAQYPVQQGQMYPPQGQGQGQFGVAYNTRPCPDCNGTGSIDCCGFQRCERCCTGCCQILGGILCCCCLEAIMPGDPLLGEVAEAGSVFYGCYKGCGTCWGDKCKTCRGAGVVQIAPPGRQVLV